MNLSPISSFRLDQLRSWRNHDSIRTYCRQVGWISERDQEAWYRRQNDDPTIKMFVIEDNHIGVGVCGLTDIDHLHRRAEFSLYIAPEQQRKGYGSKSLKMLFDFGFYELNLHMIWGETFSGNPAAKLFESIGMLKDGTRRDFYFKRGMYVDAHLYSITREEWDI